MEGINENTIDLAAQFVNSTASHIFLTGKAGTGKTTFLRDIAERTHKKYAIVAPTGIAALNAGGVTIHSMFQLPFGTYLPDRSPSGSFSTDSSIFTEFTLGKKHFLSAAKKQVLREIDILIIDEVSMLRADILDAIDYRLRSARGNHHQSFGGVQVLMIGDLFQLPPVVRDHEWSYLRRYYHSIHFFEAKCLQSEGFVYIELEKIFRQTDEEFIHLLNNFRNNVPTAADIEKLNSRYKSPAELKDLTDIITVTTHNHLADQLNRDSLRKLNSPLFTYTAEIIDEFPETIYPIPEKLELKVGSQVMFVKNDSSGEGKYYNGRIAKVIKLDDDCIEVSMRDTNETYILVQEEWENKKYRVNEVSRELDEEIIGKFRQFPIKLAWAITVHKSQGLTFDRAVLDVGSAFASGQVYVALSRLKSLDGLILRTRIDQNVVPSDPEIVSFSGRKAVQGRLEHLLTEHREMFLQRLVTTTFDFAGLVRQLGYIAGDADLGEFTAEGMKPVLQDVKDQLQKEGGNTSGFRNQLMKMLSSKEYGPLRERLEAGSSYYRKLLLKCLKELLVHTEEVKQLKRQRGYLSDLAEVDQLLMKKLEEIIKVSRVVSCVVGNQEIPKESIHIDRTAMLEEARGEARKNAANRPPEPTRKKKRGAKGKKLLSYEESLALFIEGKSIEEIAAQRSLVRSTIEGHLLESVRVGLLGAEQLVSSTEMEDIATALHEKATNGKDGLYQQCVSNYGYFKIRAVSSSMAHHES